MIVTWRIYGHSVSWCFPKDTWALGTRLLMTWTSCAVGMRNAILRNHLNHDYLTPVTEKYLYFLTMFITLSGSRRCFIIFPSLQRREFDSFPNQQVPDMEHEFSNNVRFCVRHAFIIKFFIHFSFKNTLCLRLCFPIFRCAVELCLLCL